MISIVHRCSTIALTRQIIPLSALPANKLECFFPLRCVWSLLLSVAHYRWKRCYFCTRYNEEEGSPVQLVFFVVVYKSILKRKARRNVAATDARSATYASVSERSVAHNVFSSSSSMWLSHCFFHFIAFADSRRSWRWSLCIWRHTTSESTAFFLRVLLSRALLEVSSLKNAARRLLGCFQRPAEKKNNWKVRGAGVFRFFS